MLKILLPIDGSERSIQAVEWVKRRYTPADVELTLLLVREDLDEMRSQAELEQAKGEASSLLAQSARGLEGFSVATQVRFGRAGEEILHFAEDHEISTIVMTKSTKTGWVRIIGSVATHVVKYADCVVVIVPEAEKVLGNL